MKINSMMRFPHPVLWSETNDYSQGAFAIDIGVSENHVTGRVHLKCNVTVTEPDIHSRCTAGEAAIGLFIVCLDTYYNRLVEIPLRGGDFAIEPGQLRGQVILRPIIWSKEQFSDFASPYIHGEFGAGPFTFNKSMVLAVGDESIIDVGAEKLAPIAAIFALVLDDSIPEGQVAIQTDEDKIQIFAAIKTHEWITQARNTADGKAILLNSVYLPAVMAVLDTMQSQDPVHEDKRWFRVFRAKLTTLGLSVDTDGILETAQALLKSPLGKLNSFVHLKP